MSRDVRVEALALDWPENDENRNEKQARNHERRLVRHRDVQQPSDYLTERSGETAGRWRESERPTLGLDSRVQRDVRERVFDRERCRDHGECHRAGLDRTD